MVVVSGGDIVLGENHMTGQNKKWGFPQHLPTIQKEIGVDSTLTSVVIKLMRKGFEMV
jgi:hypothetical protein